MHPIINFFATINLEIETSFFKNCYQEWHIIDTSIQEFRKIYKFNKSMEVVHMKNNTLQKDNFGEYMYLISEENIGVAYIFGHWMFTKNGISFVNHNICKTLKFQC